MKSLANCHYTLVKIVVMLTLIHLSAFVRLKLKEFIAKQHAVLTTCIDVKWLHVIMSLVRDGQQFTLNFSQSQSDWSHLLPSETRPSAMPLLTRDKAYTNMTYYATCCRIMHYSLY